MAKKLKIYAVTHDILGDTFWEVFRRGLLDAAERFGVDVEHLRPGKFSPEIQAGLIEGAHHAGPAGIISTVPDIGAVEGPLRRIIADGIPVICVNAKDSRPVGQRIPYLFYIGGDDFNAGEMAGRYMLQHVGARPAVCVDHYLYEHICHSDRWHGFKCAFDKAGVPAERLRIPGGQPAECARAVADYMSEYADVTSVLTLGPPGAEAVLDAEALVGPGRAWKHLTFDVAKPQIDGIRAGRILATIDCQQYLQGFLAVQHMWMHLTQGFTLAADIYTGPAIVDITNIDEAEKGMLAGIR